jgi:hypothetical protein
MSGKKVDAYLNAQGKDVEPDEAPDKVEVEVSVPEQKKDRQLVVKGKPFTSLDEFTGGEFTPFRPVIRLRLEEATKPGVEVTHFDPAITIRVRYTPKDLKDAGNKGLVLGYWDGQWIRFKEKHQFRLEPNEPAGAGGFGVVVLSDWVDPPLAWG